MSEVIASEIRGPWSVGTFRTFPTAIFLPIALFLVQRFLSQYLS